MSTSSAVFSLCISAQFWGETMNPEWFAGRLRELREQAGLTQQQLADAAGLSLGGIRDLEQGRRRPSWETALVLCTALGVQVAAFTVAPKEAPAPKRGRPRKATVASERTPGKPARSKRKRG
jgi:transcriptional regulator with XRE-family HTH domain